MKLNELKDSLWAAASVFIFGICYAISSPIVTEGYGFQFYNPYQVTWLQNMHVFGTFFWIYFIDWWQRRIANQKFNEYWFDIVVGGSAYALLSHYPWLIIINNILVRPYKLSLISSFVIIYVGSEIIIILQLVLWKFIKQKRNEKLSKLDKENTV